MTGEGVVPRYDIVRGGLPSPEQIAALTVALTPVTVTPVVEEPAAVSPIGIPAWQHAALLEGVGERVVVSPDDLWARATLR